MDKSLIIKIIVWPDPDLKSGSYYDGNKLISYGIQNMLQNRQEVAQTIKPGQK